MQNGIYYTPNLANVILRLNKESEIVNYLKEQENETISSIAVEGLESGIVYELNYYFNGQSYASSCCVGRQSFSFSNYPGSIYSLTLRDVGGEEIPSQIAIYPSDFNSKDEITNYLDDWNSENDINIGDTIISSDERDEIVYTDNLSFVLEMVNNLVDVVTYALVAFTALSLIVSTVMIAIITYVSVAERVKEIGVIRALGGRKKMFQDYLMLKHL